MTARRNAWFFAAALVLAACPDKDKEKDDDDGSKKDKSSSTSETKTSTPPASTTPAPVTTETAPRPAGIEPKVKAEVDNRADGITGVALNVAGAKAALQSPTGWTTTKGETTVVTSTDQKARLAAAGFGPEGPDAKLAAAATAAGLTNCQWAGPEPVTAGKDKLAGQAADGLCTRGAGQVKAAYLATEGLLVLGSWDDGGDQANVFGSMRSVVKAAQGVDSVAACCAAIRQNMKSAPPQQIPFYTAAAGACDNLKGNPQGRAMLGQVRSMLKGAGGAVPGTCN